MRILQEAINTEPNNPLFKVEAADVMVLQGDLEGARKMLENIAENGSADLHHSLNSLDLNKSPDSIAHSLNEDGYRLDFFFRYNQTFQYFFDASSRIKTRF